MDISNLLSTEQVAERLGVKSQTVLKMARNGTLPYVAINSRLFRYRPEEIEKYLQSRHHSNNGSDDKPLPKPEDE